MLAVNKNMQVAIADGQIAAAIERAQGMLDETDEDGAAICARETWDRAVALLFDMDREARRSYGFAIDSPSFERGPDGSIDLHWNRSGWYELLVNVPADPGVVAEYYGDDVDGNVAKGKIARAGGGGPLLWLIRTR